MKSQPYRRRILKSLQSKIAGCSALILVAAGLFTGCGRPVDENKLIGTWNMQTPLKRGNIKTLIYTYEKDHTVFQRFIKDRPDDNDYTHVGHWRLDGNVLISEWEYTTNTYSHGERTPFVVTEKRVLRKLNDSVMVWGGGPFGGGWNLQRVASPME